MHDILHRTIIVSALLVLLAALALPSAAVNGTISISYRGPGGHYLGDTIIFDGINTYGDVTLIRITGPNLPAEGVPVYDLNGAAGSGNTIAMNPDGTWKFAYYTGSIKGSEKIETARYYFTVFDQASPDRTSTTSILLKRPEFYVAASPSSATFGDYIQLTGAAEKGSSNVHFDITDSKGQVVHAYESTVSSSGYFNKGFHVDMPPGVYTITMTSPSVRSTYRNYLTIKEAAPVEEDADNGTGTEPAASMTPTPAPGTPGPTVPAVPGTGSLSVTSNPAGATIFLNSVMVGTTPYSAESLPAGTYRVEVKAPGYLTSMTTIELKAGETTAISPVLVRGSGSAPVSIPALVTGLLLSLAVLITAARRQKP